MSELEWPATFDELIACGYRDGGSGKCRSCGHLIDWLRTPLGRYMQVEAVEVAEGGIALYQSHFATCPQASQHRRKRTTAPGVVE